MQPAKIIHTPRRYVVEEWGGTETVVMQLARQQKAAGLQPLIFTSLALSVTKSEVVEGTPVRRFSYRYPFFGLSPEQVHALDKKGGNMVSLSLFAALLREPGVRLFHAHAINRLGGMVRTAARLRKLAGAPEPAAVQFTNRVEGVQSLLRVLTPQTDGQRQLLAQAQQIAGDMSQTRWLLMEEAQNELPVPLLVILVCWLTVLFVSFGLFAPRNATVLSVLFVCACSVSAAVFLILEMNRPLEGMIKVSNAPLRNALEHLGR